MFGFVQTPRKIFNQNFLRTVIFSIKFKKCSNLSDKKKELKEIFDREFPRFRAFTGKSLEILIQDNEFSNLHTTEQGEQIEMRSLDGQKLLAISKNSMSLIVNGVAYQSFENFQHDLNNIIEALKILDIPTLTFLGLRKINIVDFKLNENPSEILNSLLNPNLIGNLNFFPNENHINHYIQSLKYHKENNFLNIKYGLNIPPQEKLEVGQVIIDIDLFTNLSTKREEINDFVTSLNKEIFNVFNFVISDNFKKILGDETN